MDGATRSTCHLTGAIAGLLVFLSLGLFGQSGLIAALVLGVIAGAVLSEVLVWLICEGVTAMDGSQLLAETAVPAAGLGVDRAELVAPVAAQPRFAALVADAGMAPSGDAQVAHGRAAPAEPEGGIYGRRAVAGPPAEDLTRITGIGPKVAASLHAAGVTRFAQIAGWDEAAIEAMAAQIGRGAGLIRRDDWVGQARALAAEVEAGTGGGDGAA
ncbi:MAG: hypothetical protein ACK41U_02425 [Paracoccus sp. (in: a-proteobacteria)]|uniref:hypothetical protein n=1 Tax=Paracoccus sp. TaxID=267 RepID=UPI003919579E